MKTKGCDKVKSTLCKDIGENSKLLRAKEHFSQEELAGEIGISVSHYRDIEHGQGNPTIKTLQKICKTLNTTPLELLSSKNNEKEILLGNLPPSLAEYFGKLPKQDQKLFCALLEQFVNLIMESKQR